MHSGGNGEPNQYTVLALCITIVFFGSNFVPVKDVHIRNYAFFQWVMCNAILLTALPWCLAQESEVQLHPIALLGGISWCCGNYLCPLIIDRLGLGVGSLLWGTVEMFTAWLSGTFGILGVERQIIKRPWLNFLGVMIVVAGGLVLSQVTSEGTAAANHHSAASSTTFSSLSTSPAAAAALENGDMEALDEKKQHEEEEKEEERNFDYPQMASSPVNIITYQNNPLLLHMLPHPPPQRIRERALFAAPIPPTAHSSNHHDRSDAFAAERVVNPLSHDFDLETGQKNPPQPSLYPPFSSSSSRAYQLVDRTPDSPPTADQQSMETANDVHADNYNKKVTSSDYDASSSSKSTADRSVLPGMMHISTPTSSTTPYQQQVLLELTPSTATLENNDDNDDEKLSSLRPPHPSQSPVPAQQLTTILIAASDSTTAIWSSSNRSNNNSVVPPELHSMAESAAAAAASAAALSVDPHASALAAVVSCSHPRQSLRRTSAVRGNNNNHCNNDTNRGPPDEIVKWTETSASSSSVSIGFQMLRLRPFEEGIILALIAGLLFGVSFNPTQYVVDQSGGKLTAGTMIVSHYVGICYTSYALYIASMLSNKLSSNNSTNTSIAATATAYTGNNTTGTAEEEKEESEMEGDHHHVSIIDPGCILPAVLAGIMWGVGAIAWFVAAETLPISVTFPLISAGPNIVTMCWSLCYFREVRGWNNQVMLGIALSLLGLGLFCVWYSNL